MRVLALAGFRVRCAMTGAVLLAPLVGLAVLQLVVLAGGQQPAAVLVVTAVSLALPALAWLARQVLDVEPDDQVLLSSLAVGGPVRGVLPGLLAAAAATAPLALLCAYGCLVRVDRDGVPAGVLLYGTGLALGTALAAVGIGAFASRSVAGRGAAPVVVLVAAPVLVAVLGLARAPLVSSLVPRLVAAVRASNPPQPLRPDVTFVAAAPAIVVQVLLWGLVVLGLRLLLARRRTR